MSMQTLNREAPISFISSVPRFTIREARRLAFNSYMSHNREADGNLNDEQLDRITVNYLRHRWTNYNSLIRACDCVEDKQLLHEQVQAYISNLFPMLREECRRQVAEKTWF